MDDPQLQEIVTRLLPLLAKVKNYADQADDFFWASLGAPKAAHPQAKLIFARAIGHVVCMSAEVCVFERGLGESAQGQVRRSIMQELLLKTFMDLPGFNGAEDARSAVIYATVPSGRGDAMKEILNAYTGELEALFRGKTSPEIRRAAKLALETWIRRSTGDAQKLLG